MEVGYNGGQVLRDEEGHVLPGSASPNKEGKGGRPPRAVELNFLARIREKVGPELDSILDGLILLATGQKIMDGERFPASVKPADRIRAAELLLAYGAGRPTQPIDANISRLPDAVAEVIPSE